MSRKRPMGETAPLSISTPSTPNVNFPISDLLESIEQKAKEVQTCIEKDASSIDSAWSYIGYDLNNSFSHTPVVKKIPMSRFESGIGTSPFETPCGKEFAVGTKEPLTSPCFPQRLGTTSRACTNIVDKRPNK